MSVRYRLEIQLASQGVILPLVWTPALSDVHGPDIPVLLSTSLAAPGTVAVEPSAASDAGAACSGVASADHVPSCCAVPAG